MAVDPSNLVRDVIEVVIVIAIGGMLVSAVLRLRRGEIQPYRCAACDRPTTRANGVCKHCGAPVS